MAESICLGNITIDCRDALRLRDFYADLLGWKKSTIGGFPVACSEGGITFLFSEADFEYARPVWPEEPGRQQKQVHFDFHVADVEHAVLRAEGLGAKKARAQFGGQQYVTMTDPEGHPFCLCAKGE